jgi:hypothetical protein
VCWKENEGKNCVRQKKNNFKCLAGGGGGGGGTMIGKKEKENFLEKIVLQKEG